jgi:hypothetical protein
MTVIVKRFDPGVNDAPRSPSSLTVPDPREIPVVPAPSPDSSKVTKGTAFAPADILWPMSAPFILTSALWMEVLYNPTQSAYVTDLTLTTPG